MSNLIDIPHSLGTVESYGVKGEYRPFNCTQQLGSLDDNNSCSY